MTLPQTSAAALAARRRGLLARFPGPAIFAAGLPPARNYAANQYPFRATSHFLYFTGAHLPGAALLFAEGRVTLFAEPPEPEDALWHGPRPSLADLRDALALDAVRPITEIPAALAALPPVTTGGDSARPVATLPPNDAPSAAWLADVLGRPVRACAGASLEGADAALADAMIDLRLTHDRAAIDQLRAAAEITAGAHLAGMRATRAARTEHDVCGAMIGELRRHGLEDAYSPIVTVHGEVLHNHHHHHAVKPGDLVLADVGGETPEGWAADITRVWPVSGAFSSSQRAIYDIVLRANEASIDRVRPGVRYRDIHETAKRVLVEGLVALGVLRGSVDGLLERGAANVFLPHGVGHLLGLDVHDMEDLGDRAGYAPGRVRSDRFGDRYLRLDRDLVPGMAVTIEPGFYLVPAILADPAIVGPLGADLDRAALERYADVRGIRIEDDVLCTDSGPEVLTRHVPKAATAVEAIVSGA